MRLDLTPPTGGLHYGCLFAHVHHARARAPEHFSAKNSCIRNITDWESEAVRADTRHAEAALHHHDDHLDHDQTTDEDDPRP